MLFSGTIELKSRAISDRSLMQSHSTLARQSIPRSLHLPCSVYQQTLSCQQFDHHTPGMVAPVGPVELSLQLRVQNTHPAQLAVADGGCR